MEEKQIKVDDLIAELNKVLINDAKSIEELIKGYKQNALESTSDISLEVFDKVVPFSTVPTKNDKDIYKALCGKRGIYIFLMIADCNINEDFNKVYYGAPLNNRKISSFKVGDILYLGKAKSIITRMGQHFCKASTFNHTGSLKLSSEERESLKGNFTVYAFCIKSKYKGYYDIIASTVESELRKVLEPLVGN